MHTKRSILLRVCVSVYLLVILQLHAASTTSCDNCLANFVVGPVELYANSFMIHSLKVGRICKKNYMYFTWLEKKNPHKC